MPLLLVGNDLGTAIEGIAQLYEGLLMVAFELVVAGGLVIVIVFARLRRLAERGQVRFEAHRRESLGFPGQPLQRNAFWQITPANWRAAASWSLFVLATVWWTLRLAATPWSPGALGIALFWASIVFALAITFDARAGRDSAATVASVHLTMASFFVWVHSH